MFIILSIIEAFYILYMFNFFKTKYSIHFKWEQSIINYYNFIKHPIKTGKYESKICKLGNIVGYFLFFWIFLRIFIYNYPYIQFINKIIFILLIIGTIIMNLNAFLYIIPVFFIEFYFIINKI